MHNFEAWTKRNHRTLNAINKNLELHADYQGYVLLWQQLTDREKIRYDILKYFKANYIKPLKTIFTNTDDLNAVYPDETIILSFNPFTGKVEDLSEKEIEYETNLE